MVAEDQAHVSELIRVGGRTVGGCDVGLYEYGAWVPCCCSKYRRIDGVVEARNDIRGRDVASAGQGAAAWDRRRREIEDGRGDDDGGRRGQEDEIGRVFGQMDHCRKTGGEEEDMAEPKHSPR